MHKINLLLLALAGGLTSLTVSAMPIGLTGDTIFIDARVPDLSPASNLETTSLVVGPGVDLSCPGTDIFCTSPEGVLFAGESFDIGEFSISYTRTGGFNASNANGPFSFNGFVFRDLDFIGGGVITGVSLVNSNLADPTIVTFGADFVNLDLRGTRGAGTTLINLTVAQVPEPAMLALFGLGLLILAGRRLRRPG